MCARLTNSALCKSKLTTSNFSIITVPATVTHSMPYSILAHLQHSLFRVGAKNSDSIIVICAVNCRRETVNCMQHVIVPVLLSVLAMILRLLHDRAVWQDQPNSTSSRTNELLRAIVRYHVLCYKLPCDRLL